MGYAPTFFGVDGMDGILTAENFDASLAEGVMLLTPFVASANEEATQKFVKAYVDAYGEEPNQFAAGAYDAVMIIYEAMVAGDINPADSASAICNALAQILTGGTFKYSGLTGNNMTWTALGSVEKDIKIVKVQ
jgi:branched-chain amino acid transport system substrate-binding protein